MTFPLPPLAPEHKTPWPRFHHGHKKRAVTRSRSNSEDSTAVRSPSKPSKLPKMVMADPAQTTMIETIKDGNPVLVFNTAIPRGVRRGQEFYVANSPLVVGSSCCSSTNTTATSSSALSLVRVVCPRNYAPGRQVAIIVPKEVATDASHCCNSLIKDVVSDHVMTSPVVPVPTEIQVDQSEHWDSVEHEHDDDGRDDCGASRVSNDHQGYLESMLLSTPASEERTTCEHPRFDNETRTHTTARTALSSPQHYQVTVPPNAVPGQTLTVLAGGRRVQVTCPPDAIPGCTIRF